VKSVSFKATQQPSQKVEMVVEQAVSSSHTLGRQTKKNMSSLQYEPFEPNHIHLKKTFNLKKHSE